jgi:hypothetical protein
MMAPVKNFDPYTATNGLHSLRSLRKFARRIKTRALRAGVLGCVLTAVVMLWALAACEEGDVHSAVVQRHETVTTTAQEVTP